MTRVTLSQFSHLGVQQALDRLAAVLGSRQSASQNVLVFRPGGAASPGVYPTWAGLVAAAQAVPGAKLVLIDASLAPCVVPAGLADFGSQTTFVGASPASAGITELLFEAGARLRNVFEFQLLTLHCSASDDTQPVIITSDLPAGLPVFTLGARVTVMADDGCLGGFLLHDRVGICLLNLTLDARITGSSQNDAMLRSPANGGTLQIIAYDVASVAAYTIRTGQFGLTIGEIASPAAMIDPAQHPWTFQLVKPAIGANVSYDDFVVQPQVNASDVQAAVDALKGSVGWFAQSRLISGTGSPQGAVVGNVGDLYVDRSGAPGQVLWVKETLSGTFNGWVAK
jgi:hypothetical protein